MAYSEPDLKAIRAAERAFYELCFAHLVVSIALYICHNKLDLPIISDRGE